MKVVMAVAFLLAGAPAGAGEVTVAVESRRFFWAQATRTLPPEAEATGFAPVSLYVTGFASSTFPSFETRTPAMP